MITICIQFLPTVCLRHNLFSLKLTCYQKYRCMYYLSRSSKKKVSHFDSDLQFNTQLIIKSIYPYRGNRIFKNDRFSLNSTYGSCYSQADYFQYICIFETYIMTHYRLCIFFKLKAIICGVIIYLNKNLISWL